MKNKNIIFGNWWKGSGQSKYDSSFFSDLKNADILTEVGTLRCNNRFIKDSGTTINEPTISVVAPSGTTYLFSRDTGKIWKRSNTGTYTSITANSNTSGHKGCGYYNGYVYYADSTNKLGRFIPDTEGSRSDSWKTLTASGSPRPMMVQNNILHIGDDNSVYTVNASDATTTALTLEDYHTVSCFHNYGYDLMVMTWAGGYKNHAGMFRWDTSSSSWSSEYYFGETSVNFVIRTDRTDTFFICAGSIGNIYVFDGQFLSFWKKIPNASLPADGHRHLQSTIFNRKGMFSMDGNVYSISIPQSGMDWALNHEYEFSVSGAAIDSLVSLGNTTLLATWENEGCGVDVIGTTYATTTATTPLVSRRIHDIIIYTDELPTGTSIGLEVNSDGSGWISKNVTVDQSDNLVVRLNGDIANKRTLQARITLNPTTETPVISHIEML